MYVSMNSTCNNDFKSMILNTYQAISQMISRIPIHVLNIL